SRRMRTSWARDFEDAVASISGSAAGNARTRFVSLVASNLMYPWRRLKTAIPTTRNHLRKVPFGNEWKSRPNLCGCDTAGFVGGTAGGGSRRQHTIERFERPHRQFRARERKLLPRRSARRSRLCRSQGDRKSVV